MVGVKVTWPDAYAGLGTEANERQLSMNDPIDHELDACLRREFEGPVADDGFAAQVMRLLPPRPRRRPWPLPAAAIVGGLLTWLTLAPSPLVELAAREWLAEDFGAS